MRLASFPIACFLFLTSFAGFTQNTPLPKSSNKPKLVVGFVVDQMRWDFLYRYYDHFGNDGFKRLINNGFNCDNTMVPYTPTITACGHTCIFTGSVPAIHGIVGNNWYDNQLNHEVYCTEDKSVSTIGSSTKAGEMSPANMFTNTITDELRLASNFKSKVIGVAVKDRGAILPAGHSANAAYWYDADNGKWISSSYYMKALPGWVDNFNARKLPDSLMANGWPLSDQPGNYKQSTTDEKNYEGRYKGASNTSFPHDFKEAGSNIYSLIRSSPFGNTMTLEFAKATIQAERMGSTGNTDFLTVSCSSTDYIGHQFGPNSLENEDDYIRLDADLAKFLKFLDEKIGRGEYVFFLTADHGVAHVPGFLKENKLPGGSLNDDEMVKDLNERVKEKFGVSNVVIYHDNYQLTLDKNMLEASKVGRTAVVDFLLPIIKKREGIANAFDLTSLNATTLPDIQRKMFSNGYYHKRSGDIQLLFFPGWIDGYGKSTGTTHGLWNPYDAHIPLVWFGWHIQRGKLTRETYMTDIAATLAALLHIQMPNGCVGQPISEVIKN